MTKHATTEVDRDRRGRLRLGAIEHGSRIVVGSTLAGTVLPVRGELGELQGFTTTLVTEPVHRYVSAWWPPGHMLGYEHGFSHQVVHFVTAIAHGAELDPTFADGLAVQRVLAAVEESSALDSVWVAVEAAVPAHA